MSAVVTQADSFDAEMLYQPHRNSSIVVRRTASVTSVGACTRTTKLEAMWRAWSAPAK